MRLPRYLLLDLVGKFLILLSVGAQLLVLGPASDRRSANRIDQIAHLVWLNHYTNIIHENAIPEQTGAPFDDKEVLKKALREGVKDMADMQIEVQQKLEPRIEASRAIVIATFFLGTLLTILGTYFEKRNKPAS